MENKNRKYSVSEEFFRRANNEEFISMLVSVIELIDEKRRKEAENKNKHE